MLGYHLYIAYKSLRRTPGNTLIVVAGIALGVAVATLFTAIRHTFARDPIPEKSASLYYVRMDSWDPQRAHPRGIPPQITYQDMIGITKSEIPIRQTGTFRTVVHAFPRTDGGRPGVHPGRYCHADFFAMFNVPFRHGSPWDRAADERAEPVVVLNEELNERWFGGRNSVGELVSVDGHDLRVIGVLSRWQPPIKFYDLHQERTRLSETLFLPMGAARMLSAATAGLVQRWKILASPGFEGQIATEYNFIQMWVELKRPQDVAAYKSFLDAYTTDQRRSGRFLRPLDNRVTPLLDYMDEMGRTPPEVTIMMIAGDLFLAACALGLIGLLLARFLARAAEIGVRRALGASRWDIFVAHVIEGEVMGVAGGLLGLALAAISLYLVNRWYASTTHPARDDLFRMDLTTACFAALASLVAALLAGVYPAYRVCRVAPASHLKVQ